MFDMTKCKIGDKLKTGGGHPVALENIDTSRIYSYRLSNGKSVDSSGKYFSGADMRDIVGFWEEDVSPQEPSSEDEQSFPNIEKRIPYVVKTVTYRIHFNELYSRDITSDEAEAIYEQLKTLLGK